MTGRRISVAMRRTDSASAGEAIGKPASMMSTPSSVELTGEQQLFGRPQRKPGRLLAVTQRRVENSNLLPWSHPSLP